MSTQTGPSTDKALPATKVKPLLPPEEKFWQHYSPHHEFSLSGVGSFTLHALAIGFIVLLGIGIIRFNTSAKTPVEAVRFNSGGGGGKPSGEGNNAGVGETPKEDVGPTDEARTPAPAEDPKPVDLDPGKAAEARVNFDEEMIRRVKSGNPSAGALAKLDETTQKKLRDGLTAGKGRGGSGRDGGKDKGKGTGDGEGTGPGQQKSALTQREKRMLRWSMTFDTGFNGNEYLNQLSGLGAILAIPTDENNPPKGYYVVENVNLKRRPVPLVEKDVSDIQCIFWVDDRPDSVRSLAQALGLRHNVSHIVAFMPPKVEEKLFTLERQYRHLKEDDIYETKFKVRRSGGGYEPYVVGQTPKR